MPAKTLLLELLRRLDNIWDQWLFRIRKRLGWDRQAPLAIAAYRGLGRPDHLFLQGRVLKYRPLYGAGHNSRWKSFVDTYRRFGSDEIRDAHLDIAFGPHTFHVVTDDEGFFSLDHPVIPPLDAPADTSWHPVNIRLVHTPWREVDLAGKADVLLPGPQAVFGVISDIDDTILQTHVTSLLKLKMLYYTLFQNAAGRQVIQEATAFFQALHRFPGGRITNPIFYVSNSPWNLYDLLLDFLSINHLPKGPVLLRDVGIPRSRPPAGGLPGHKYQTIQRILQMYPDLPFILIGDSGESDADIYLDIARNFPNRIRTIYIRDVRSPRLAGRIAGLIRVATGVDIQLFHLYREAARDAAAKDLLLLQEFEKWQNRLS